MIIGDKNVLFYVEGEHLYIYEYSGISPQLNIDLWYK